jgi:transcriptional regulator with XRE-family HTH domain
MKDDTQALAQKLGISEKQLERLERKYRFEHGDKAEEALLATLKQHWEEMRDKRWLLSRHPSSFVVDENGVRHYGYTESPADAMRTTDEGVPPTEITSYRESVQARIRFQQEKADEVEDVKAAMMELKSTIDALPRETKRGMGRSFWILRTRLDASLRDLKRRAAA